MDTFKILNLEKYSDERGVFVRTFDHSWLNFDTQQSNISFNPTINTLRGMHFQKSGPPENKIITLITGSIFIAVVDLRQASSDFLNPKSISLDLPLTHSLYIPSGFATGWISTSENTTLQYLMSAKYEDCTYGGIRFDDPSLDIDWPSQPSVISSQDINWPKLEFEK